MTLRITVALYVGLILVSCFRSNYCLPEIHITKTNNQEVNNCEDVLKLRGEITSLRQENVVLSRTVEEQSTKLIEFEDRLAFDTERLSKLIKHQDARLDYLESRTSLHNAEYGMETGEDRSKTAHSDANNAYRSTGVKARQINDKYKTGIFTTCSCNSDIVAFYAYLTTAIVHPTPNQLIKFEKAVTNIGQSYDAQSGLFTCQTAGIYLFSWTIFADAGAYCHTALTRNGDVVAHVYFGQGTYASTGSNSVILDLHEGDRVFVKFTDDNPSAFIPNAPFSSFSGILLGYL